MDNARARFLVEDVEVIAWDHDMTLGSGEVGRPEDLDLGVLCGSSAVEASEKRKATVFGSHFFPH